MIPLYLGAIFEDGDGVGLLRREKGAGRSKFATLVPVGRRDDRVARSDEWPRSGRWESRYCPRPVQRFVSFRPCAIGTW